MKTFDVKVAKAYELLYKNTGAYDIKYGDRIVYTDGREGFALGFMPDGDVDIKLDDETFITVKWSQIKKI